MGGYPRITKRITEEPRTYLVAPIAGFCNDSGEAYSAMRLWDGRFIAVRVHKSGGDGVLNSWHGGQLSPYKFAVYHPIHPSVTKKQIEGATHAIDNGTHWEFAHSNEHEHHEVEALASALLIAKLQPFINRSLFKMGMATNNRARRTATESASAFQAFCEAAVSEIETAHRAAPLGEWVRERKGHHRALAAAAITKTLADWKTKGLTDATIKTQRGLVATDVTALAAKLTATPALKTKATLAAEAAAAAAAAKKSGSGS